MSRAYYNENNPHAARWLRNLISEGLIADGDVDERSIADVAGSDLAGYSQCHFFAGIGGWSLALRLAGVPDDYPVWSGSAPCQPFSQAGKQKGASDERHLWPVFFDLIRECRPARVVGEQVASAIAHGWLDALQDDLEGECYACGAVIAPACGVGAPHIRERLFWVGQRVDDSSSARHDGEIGWAERYPWDETRLRMLGARGGFDGLANANKQGISGRGVQRPGEGDRSGDGASLERPAGFCADGRLADIQSDGCREERAHPGREPEGNRAQGIAAGLEPGGDVGRLVQPDSNGREPRMSSAETAGHGGSAESAGCTDRPHASDGFWANPDWLFCRDGKWRPVEPGSFPLAHGLPGGLVAVRAERNGEEVEHTYNRPGALRGFGNAIVPQLAAEFIMAVMS